MGAYILGTGAYLPDKRLTNHEIAERLDTSDEWIVQHTGISERRIAAEGESTADMAAHAARQALERARISPAEIGAIVLSTSTPDFFGFPSTACILQQRLGAVNASAFDISAACSGFSYGLHIADGMLVKDPRPILVVSAEAMSRVLDWNDRNTCILFGDGAGAVVLGLSEDSERGIRRSCLGADGSGWDALMIGGGGLHTAPWTERYVRMKGRQVFNFAARIIVEVIEKLVRQEGVGIQEVAHIVPHQANMRIIGAAAKRLGIPVERFSTNLNQVANTSSASIPLVLNEMVEQKLVKSGEWVITVGFGAGLTYAGNLIKW